MRTIAILCLIISVCIVQGLSQDTASAKAFGKVEFANSGSRAAQADFLEGMALLHDFEYGPAAEAFRRAEAIDPGFAMAYWGEAMTFNHPIWMQQDLGAGRAALAKLGSTPAERLGKAKTAREKAYLQTAEVLYGEGSKTERDLRLEAAMSDLHKLFPDDVDAAAFYGLSILGTAHAGRDIAIYMRAAAVLEQAWIDHHEHPGLVHYLIHCYDDPNHAPLGLRAARIYATIAPRAGHAQHMTSHIFVALGMWNEVVNSNLKAMNVVNIARKSAGKGPMNCGHYPSWLGYGYLQLGQRDKAIESVARCMAMTTTPSDKDLPNDELSSAVANMRLRYVIDAGSLPDEIARWDLPGNAGPWTRLDYYFALFLSENRAGRTAQAADALKQLETSAQEIIDIAVKNADVDPTNRTRSEIFRLEARALMAEHAGQIDEAERLLVQAAALEDKLPLAFGPPVIDKPTHELLGEFLLRRGRTADAHNEFRKAVARTPGRKLTQEGFEKTGGNTSQTAAGN